MKYRVKQIGSSFCPQYRDFLGFWCNFTYCASIEGPARTHYFANLEQAKDFIKLKDKETQPLKIIIHKYEE